MGIILAVFLVTTVLLFVFLGQVQYLKPVIAQFSQKIDTVKRRLNDSNNNIGSHEICIHCVFIMSIRNSFFLSFMFLVFFFIVCFYLSLFIAYLLF